MSYDSEGPLPPPLLHSPLLGGLALLGARSCKTRAGGRSGAGAPARPRGCQADVVGHLKFTEGGGRVKVMVSRLYVSVCVSAADGRARSISPSRNLRGGAHAKGPRGCCGPGGRGGTGSDEQGHARAVCSANIPLFFPPSRYARSRLTGLGLCFFPLPLGREKEKKKNAPVQSFLRLPARGSEDNITYVIYMHIKSLAGGCECRKILCEEEEEKAAQSGRARREAPRCDSQKTRSSWWKCACTWPGRASLLLGRAWAARGGGGWCPGRAPPREACPARTKWVSVFSANLPLDGNFGS